MNEGISALDDATNDLKKASIAKPFIFTGGLANAADLQLTDLKVKMSLEHRSKDGGDVESIIEKYGKGQINLNRMEKVFTSDV